MLYDIRKKKRNARSHGGTLGFGAVVASVLAMVGAFAASVLAMVGAAPSRSKDEADSFAVSPTRNLTFDQRVLSSGRTHKANILLWDFIGAEKKILLWDVPPKNPCFAEGDR